MYSISRVSVLYTSLILILSATILLLSLRLDQEQEINSSLQARLANTPQRTGNDTDRESREVKYFDLDGYANFAQGNLSGQTDASFFSTRAI